MLAPSVTAAEFLDFLFDLDLKENISNVSNSIRVLRINVIKCYTLIVSGTQHSARLMKDYQSEL